MRKHLKINQLVIVNDKGTLKVGALSSRTIKHQKRVFNVRLEDGCELLYIPVNDSENSKTYIDGKLTSHINQVNTRLSVGSRGNFAQNCIFEN